MNYSLADLAGRNLATTKACLERNGETLNVVALDGETVPDTLMKLADRVTVVDRMTRETLAVLKSPTGNLWDVRVGR